MKFDKETIIGLILCMVVMFAWPSISESLGWSTPAEVPAEESVQQTPAPAPAPAAAETKVEKLMRVLNLTEQEALEVIECDKRIDRGEKLFELTEDQKVAEKQARLTGERKSTKTTKREKKVDNQKQNIISTIRPT